MTGRVVRPTSAFGLVRKVTRGQLQRRRAAERHYREVRIEVVERDHFKCIRCGEPGVEVHHRMNRGAGGGNAQPLRTHCKSRLVLLCRVCHRWVGDNPLDAMNAGLLVRHGVFRCDEVPVLYLGRWVLLRDTGEITPSDSKGGA